MTTVKLPKRKRYAVSDTRMRLAIRRRKVAWDELSRFDNIAICDMNSSQRIVSQYWAEERNAMTAQILMGLRERGGFWNDRGRKLVVDLDGITIADVTPEMIEAYKECIDKDRYMISI